MSCDFPFYILHMWPLDKNLTPSDISCIHVKTTNNAIEDGNDKWANWCTAPRGGSMSGKGGADALMEKQKK